MPICTHYRTSLWVSFCSLSTPQGPTAMIMVCGYVTTSWQSGLFTTWSWSLKHRLLQKKASLLEGFYFCRVSSLTSWQEHGIRNVLLTEVFPHINQLLDRTWNVLVWCQEMHSKPFPKLCTRDTCQFQQAAVLSTGSCSYCTCLGAAGSHSTRMGRNGWILFLAV